MAIFKNIIVAFVLIGLLTRAALFFYRKKFSYFVAAWLSFFSVGVIFLPLFSFITEWDIVVSEYLVALIIWLIFDLIRMGKKEER